MTRNSTLHKKQVPQETPLGQSHLIKNAFCKSGECIQSYKYASLKTRENQREKTQERKVLPTKDKNSLLTVPKEIQNEKIKEKRQKRGVILCV